MNLRYRWQQMMGIAILVLWGLFKINLTSAVWNVVIGLVITAILLILTGYIPND